MRIIKEYFDFINEEAAPRLPKNIKYWVDRLGKKGKDVCIYTHNDMDGIFSAIAIRNYLIEQGFSVEKFGILDYQEAWSNIEIDSTYINIAVDFADPHPGINCYIDHHGSCFGPENVEYQVKTKTHSAFEGIMDQIGKPVDSLTLDVINMIDSALYDKHKVKWIDLLDFDLKEIIKKPNGKMLFAGAFNQLLKRSDYKTFMEVIHNADNVSIYRIFSLFKKFFPKNNPEYTGRGATRRKVGNKNFIDDARIRLNTMTKRTSGDVGTEDNPKTKTIFRSQKQFRDKFLEYDNRSRSEKIKPDGYQIIGKVIFFPSGIWVNPIRARAIMEDHVNKGIIPADANIVYIVIQYGSSMQIIINNVEEPEYAILKDGTDADNMDIYTEKLLQNFKDHMGYNVEKTTAGGHVKLGNITNILGVCKKSPFQGIKYLDLFKNKVIKDLSGISDWNVGMSWGDPEEREPSTSERERELNKRVKNVKSLRTIDKYGNLVDPVQPDDDYFEE